MKLTVSQLEVLHIFWSVDAPLSVEELAEKSRFRLFRGIRTKHIVEQLINKGLVSQVGLHQNFSSPNGTFSAAFAPTVHFAEFYCERFREVSPNNLLQLMEGLLCSGKFSQQMLYEFHSIHANG